MEYIFMFLGVWYFVGLLTMGFVLRRDHLKGIDTYAVDFLASIGISTLGPIVLIICLLIMYDLDARFVKFKDAVSNKLIVKGK